MVGGKKGDKWFLREGYLMEWKSELIESYLSQIGLENLRVTSQKFAAECTITEPIYGTNYSVEKLEKVEASECDVRLPPPNPFSPEDLSLLPLSTQ
jgi:hypothetical protein